MNKVKVVVTKVLALTGLGETSPLKDSVFQRILANLYPTALKLSEVSMSLQQPQGRGV